MADNIDIMRRGYELFNKGDIPGVLALFDKDIEWTEPEWHGYGPPAGTFCGTEEIGSKVFAPVGERFDSFTCEPHTLLADGDHVIVEGTFRMEPKGLGRTISVTFVQTWTLRDGKPTSLRNYIDAKELVSLNEARHAA
jgi:ketosteroid isomerase-like protein